MKSFNPGDRVVIVCPPGYRLGEPALPGDTGFILGKFFNPINFAPGYIIKLDTDDIRVWISQECLEKEKQVLLSWKWLRGIWQPPMVPRSNKPSDYSSDKWR